MSSVILLFGSSLVMAQNPSLVSINKNGTDSGNGTSVISSGSISADGRFVAFASRADDLTEQDANGAYDVFVRDLRTGTTTLASVNASGAGSGNGSSGTTGNIDFVAISVSLSADGRFVAFTSAASDLVANDTNGKEDDFVRDLDAGITMLASVNSAGTASGNGASLYPYLSADGSMVGFRSLASDLVQNDTNNTYDVFVRNLKTGVTTLVSLNSAGTASGNRATLFSTFSADGQIVAFTSRASDLVANDSNGTQYDDIFVRNLQTGTTTLVSASAGGAGSGNNHSSIPLIAADGGSVVFNSRATNLASATDVNGTDDVFVRNLATATTSLVSINQAGTGTGTDQSYIPSPAAISANGNIIAFVSNATDLVANDTNGTATDAFIRDVAAGTTKLVTVNSAGTGSGNSFSISYEVSVSADGRFVIFDSTATDLVEPLSGFADNVFVRDMQLSTTTLVSPNVSRTNGGNQSSLAVTLSADGSVAIFSSFATDLVATDTNNVLDVFAFALSQPGNIGFSAPTYSTVEGQTTATLTVTRTGGRSGAVSATLTTGDGTAVAGQDYAAVSQVVAFADGDTASKTVTVPITDDTLVEGSETINLTLSSPTGGAVLGSTASAILTLIDNDSTCNYSINPSSRTSPAAGESFMVDVTAQSGCGWTAVSNSNFISVTAGASGNGNGSVTLAIASNGSSVPRTGAIIIAGQTFTVTQPELVPEASTIQFNQAAYQASEGVGRVTFTVTRTGDTSGTARVDYRTTDTDTFTVGCADAVSNGGGAFARCDFATTVGTLSFAAGEQSKIVTVPIIDDGHVEGAETFQLQLSNAAGEGTTLGAQNVSTVTITNNDAVGAPNPIITLGPSNYPFFVRQQYLDFLSREPEAGEPWTAVMNRCANVNTGPTVRTDCDRISVSGAFFGSPEFQLKGFYAFRFYKLAFNRLPQYTEIVADMSFVAGATEGEVYARRAQLATAFAARQEFANAYASMTNAEYVAALLGRYGLSAVATADPATPNSATRITLSSTDLTNGLNAGTWTRAQVLRAVADSDQVGGAEYNSAFVAVQYYGYLRRTPEPVGYQQNLSALQRGVSPREMINAFLNSAEYRLRFGQP